MDAFVAELTFDGHEFALLARLALARARAALGENGVRWTVLYALARSRMPAAGRLLEVLEQRHGLPGANSVAANRDRWQHWDWARRGEEWTESEEWKHALVDDVLLRWIPPGGTVLEVGPGAGRWSETLCTLADRLVLVDVTEECVRLCRERFAGALHVECHVNDGRSLPFLDDASVDAIWSFDVFVHVSARDTGRYVEEFARVLRPGATAVVHHPTTPSPNGWRSNTTNAVFLAMLERSGLEVLAQFDSWGPGGCYDVRRYADVITVFRRPI